MWKIRTPLIAPFASTTHLPLLPAWTLGIWSLCFEQLLYSCIWVARVVSVNLQESEQTQRFSQRSNGSASARPCSSVSHTPVSNPTALFRPYYPQSSLPSSTPSTVRKLEKTAAPGVLCPFALLTPTHPSPLAAWLPPSPDMPPTKFTSDSRLLSPRDTHQSVPSFLIALKHFLC